MKTQTLGLFSKIPIFRHIRFISSSYRLVFISILLLSGVSTLNAQYSLEHLDKGRQVLAIQPMENGFVYYLQELKIDSINQKTFLLELKVFDGYQIVNLGKLSFERTKKPDVELLVINRNYLVITDVVESSLYVYDINNSSLQTIYENLSSPEVDHVFIDEGAMHFVLDEISREFSCVYRFTDSLEKVCCYENLTGAKYLIPDYLVVSETYDYDLNSYMPIEDQRWEIYDLYEFDPAPQIINSQTIIDATEHAKLEDISIERVRRNENIIYFTIRDQNEYEYSWNLENETLRIHEMSEEHEGDFDHFGSHCRMIRKSQGIYDISITNSRDEISIMKDIRIPDYICMASSNFKKGLWLGTQDGLIHFKIDPEVIQLFQNESMRSIATFNDSSILVALERSYFHLVDRDKNTISAKSDQISHYNKFIHKTENGNFIANAYYEIIELNDDFVSSPPRQELRVSYGVGFENDQLIISVSNKAVYLYDLKSQEIDSFQVTKNFHSLTDAIQLDSFKGIAVSRQGMFQLNLENATVSDSITGHKGAICIEKGQESNYFVGYLDGRLREFDIKNNAILNSYEIGEAIVSLTLVDSNLWIGTLDGLAVLKTKTKHHYFIDPQLLSHPECNRFSSHYDSVFNQLYIGTINGLNILKVDDFLEERPFEIYFSQIAFTASDNEELRKEDYFFKEKFSVDLPAKNRQVYLSFSSPKAIEDDRINYKYSLNKGPWIDIKTGNELNFPYLESGKNSVEIKGFIPANLPSKNSIYAEINVGYFFYETWWFRLLIAGFFLFLGLYWYRRISRENIRLENTVKERTKQLRKDKEIIEEQTIELKALDQAKNQFFANISHELRTPLTLLISPLEQLEKSMKTDKERYFINLVKDNTEILKDRIDEMLELSRLSSGKVKLAEQNVSLGNLIDFSTRIFNGKFEEKGITYSIEKKGTESYVICDESRLSKVIQNLISNALKFTSHGGSVRSFFRLEDGILKIKVIDTGVGMTEEQSSKVFDRFYQVQSDNTIANPGTGIGLSMVKEYVELMKGSIDVTSEIGKGTSFEIILPIRTSEETDLESEEMKISSYSFLKSSDKASTKPKLLLVEDNHDLRKYASTLLSEYFEISAVEDGMKALSALEAQKVDIILSDIMMPEMDGISLLKKVRTNEMFRTIPFIFLTARHNESDILKAYRMGVDDYVKKPFNETELLHRLNAVYKNYRTRVELIPSEEDSSQKLNENNHQQESQLIIEIKEYILSEMSSIHFSAITLAEHFNLSRRQMTRIVTKEIGMSLKQFITEVRLNEARRLYESRQCVDISQVCQQIGLTSTRYFRKLFFERFGTKWN